MLDNIRKVRHLSRRIGLKYKKIKLEEKIAYMGSLYGGFSVCCDYIKPNSVVYSFGIGEDISFDLGVIENFGCNVYAFDPTPKSLKWLETQNLPSKYSYKAIGLANKDGVMTFAMPKNSDYVSISSVLNNYQDTQRIELPVSRLNTIMKELKHSTIDVLKMDIEGSEYEVIEDIIKERILIKQILIEFHHRFKSIGYKKTNEAIKNLEIAGYRLFHISDNGEEMSFIYIN